MTKGIPLATQRRSNSRNLGLVALVDDEDFEWLSQWNWTAVSTHRRNGGYAVRIQDGKTLELAFCNTTTRPGNRRLFKSNQSGCKGVHFDKQLGKWCLVRTLIAPKKPLGGTTVSLELCLASMPTPTLTSRRIFDNIKHIARYVQ